MRTMALNIYEYLSLELLGVIGPRKHQFLASLLRSTRSNVVFLAEIKCSLRKSKLILQQLSLPNHKIIPSRGRSGGLWLLWMTTPTEKSCEKQSS